MNIYNNEISTTAYDGGTHRIERIQRVIGYVCALGDHYGNPGLLEKVAAMHDHKGQLTVTWRKPPTQGEKEFFAQAWRSTIGDGSDDVVHKVE